MSVYEERVEQYQNNLQKQWDIVEDIIERNVSIGPDCDTIKLKNVKSQVLEQFAKFDSIGTEFSRFLVNTRTDESLKQAESLSKVVIANRTMTNKFVEKLRSLKTDYCSVSSRHSHSNRSSRSSTPSEQWKRLQTAKAKAAFAEQSAQLERQKAEIDEQEKIRAATAMRKKAEIEIDLKLVEDRKEVAIAETELGQSQASSEVSDIPNTDPDVKTAEYILKEQHVKSNLNPNIPEYVPKSEPLAELSEATHELTRYLLRKDLVLSRLTTYTDEPSNFQSWKYTFISVVKEIGVSPAEEIDLLIKWLGPTSRRQASSLKIAYIHDPRKGLGKIWNRLDERYGSPESVYHATVSRLESFPKLAMKESAKLYDLADIVHEIEGLKLDPQYATTLSYFDSAVGVNPIISKLPYNLQEKWTTRATNYKSKHGVHFPPFSVLAEFISEQSKIRNNPSFLYDTASANIGKQKNNSTVNQVQSVRKEVSARMTNIECKCPIHKTAHSLESCRVFKEKSVDERKKFLSANKLCFKCFESDHVSRECKCDIKCGVCSGKHATLMHLARDRPTYGGEEFDRRNKDNVTSSCTEICGNIPGKSCAKVILLNMYCIDNPNNVVTCYAILDDQSNRSLIKPELFNMLGITSEHYEYVLNSCAGSVVTSGRRADHCVIESVAGTVRYNLPTLIECTDIPGNKNEICTPDNARCHNHLYGIADSLAEFDEKADVLLLIGRDVPEAHHVFEQVVGPPGAPFAQRLGLGWVVIGEVCLGQVHSQDIINVHKSHVLSDGRTSLFSPCISRLSVQEPVDDLVFLKTPDDERPSLSIEDRQFIELMDSEFSKDCDSSWVAPLPLRASRERLPNNKAQVLNRAKALDRSLAKNPIKKQHFVEFMDNLFKHGHAELAPPLKPQEECWFLPIFGVYHPKKPDRIRVVFDSSADFEGMSLNSILLQGPDLTNSLLGVLMRFRRDRIAVMADIEQMFFSFFVHEKHRNLLRFFWHQDNDPDKQLVEFRMAKHVFGNSPSPAIATYGLRKSVEKSDSDVCEFVNKDFYVDDGLSSQPSVSKAVSLLQRTQADLAESGLRLHKFASNDSEVLKSFHSDDLAKDLKGLDFDYGNLPTQRSLGVGWDLNRDVFTFNSDLSGRPVTKRGILSTINSVFDPLGFLSPVVLEGRLLLREVMSFKGDWDDPVPQGVGERWLSWRTKLKDLDKFQIGRCYFKGSLSEMARVELHIFSDASVKAISAVVYVLAYTVEGEGHVGFVAGKSKLAPEKGHTIPRLELCGAVLAVELFQTVAEHIGVHVDSTKFYTDSKVVLGYICNQSRRFYTYVSNRVQKIRHFSDPTQWTYVPTEKNPADIGSRGASLLQLSESSWLSGPQFLLLQSVESPKLFPLLHPDQDKEVRSNVSVAATRVDVQNCLGCCRFQRFSSWSRLVRALSNLRHIAISYRLKLHCKGWHVCPDSKKVPFKLETSLYILRQVQQEAYPAEIKDLSTTGKLRKDSSIISLDPFLDKDGLLHVGGRLRRSSLPSSEKHPILLSGKSPVSELLIQHYHESVKHQGRLFTEGAVRSAGFWITNGKRLVSSVIHACVICKKLRGQFASQKMSDLPIDRIEALYPFSYVGVDVFGPWQVVARRTRGGVASSKRWAVMFTCLSIRAVHIEVVEEMSSSAFVNALRRFVSVRGKVKQFRSDRGTNFVGATDDIQVDVINVEDENTGVFLRKSDSIWIFNSPHSSHMGGSWERMIGIARRILDAMLLNVRNLTHDVLVTLMAEVSAIINARPIVPVSSDPDAPEVLSPSSLLTLKLQPDQQPVGDMDIKNLYKNQWRQVQYLASQFWARWRREFLQSLQARCKWKDEQEPLMVDDVVLLKDTDVARNCWPLGRVSCVYPSTDGRIRKVEVCVIKDGNKAFYTRPVVNLVLLVRSPKNEVCHD